MAAEGWAPKGTELSFVGRKLKDTVAIGTNEDEFPAWSRQDAFGSATYSPGELRRAVADFRNGWDCVGGDQPGVEVCG